ESDDEIKRRCLEYRQVLRAYLDRDKVKDIIKKASQRVLFQEESIDWKSFVSETMAELEPYAMSLASKSNGSVDEVDFSDAEALNKMFQRASEEIGNDGILKTGWQGINRMTGEHGGIRRGECVVVGALQHNYKTGFTLNLFKQ